MNIKETLNLKAGTKLKCIYPRGCDFKEGETYEISDFTHDGCPTIFANEGDCLPFIASGLLNDGSLIVCFGSESAVFEIIEDKEEEATNANTQDYNIGDKLTCVESDSCYFTENKEYPIEALKITADGLQRVYIVDDEGDSVDINEIKPDSLTLYNNRFVKSSSIKKPTAKPLMDQLLELGPHRAWIDDYSEDQARIDEMVEVITGKDEGGWYVTGDNMPWQYAIPVNAQGEEVTRIEDADTVEPEKPIDRLLKDGPHCASVSDESEEKAAERKFICLIRNKADDGWYEDESGTIWKYAVPIDARGNVITKL